MEGLEMEGFETDGLYGKELETEFMCEGIILAASLFTC